MADTPERKIRKVVDDCADCDVCRYLMDVDCQFFPELYRLWDKDHDDGIRITDGELRNLADLCNFCALCPCPNIRADIVEAKTRFIDRDGLKFGIRTLEDVERMSALCGLFPALANRFLKIKSIETAIKKAVGIHTERRLPEFPPESFPGRAAKTGLRKKPVHSTGRKVAYFAGCTANYLFPEVARAAVAVLQKTGIEVFFPEQKCCGMPSLLEGDRKTTLDFVGYNMQRLAKVVSEGFDIVCSCPTCGFMLREILKEGAYYSEEYQQSAGGGPDNMIVPTWPKHKANPDDHKTKVVHPGVYKGLFKDDGYFSSISALDRIAVAENTYDLGEYLIGCQSHERNFSSKSADLGRMVYYPPCHLREMEIGRPYLELMTEIPEIDLQAIDGSLDCCGMAGIMGFKKNFHETSIRLGRRLIEKIRSLEPECIVTDCLSCRLQFQQVLPCKVFHPIEILNKALTAIDD
jgi:glycerol-3-phosphate dehydrogenase subunit C